MPKPKPKKRTKKIDGFKVVITDSGTPGYMRFGAYYDRFPEFFGNGETEAAAIAEMTRKSTEYHKRREREMWDDYDDEKARRQADGDY